MDRKLLTVKELAETLQISRSVAYEVVHIQDFPVLKVGRSIRIPSDALDQWIKDHTN